ncbi:hypothetical protein [Virgibacillus ihumii]|uniref:hypothetical protein n=1 Tax=Virgibacillus ihumii TaxID=2686091 RepID=UPI00157D6EB9|nr:hypothetical protein [Virgibacillus ihumii]
MQAENLTGGQELLCINTEKVYDWIINEASFDLALDDLVLPVGPDGTPLECGDIVLDSVTCTVAPDETNPFDILDRTDQQFVIDGTQVTLQLVNIRKNFEVTVFADVIPELGGGTVEIGSADFTRCEQVILCAPEGTDIEVSYTDLECFVCTAACDGTTTTEPDELDVTVSVRLCQSIQSVFEVTLEIVADFCEPREELPIPPCPAPTIPPQCPVVFPNNGTGDNG